MKKLFLWSALMAVMLGGAITIAAQEDMPPEGFRRGGGQGRPNFQMPEFADLDKNKDKKLSRNEMPQMLPPQAFDFLDENRDGSIDEEEWNRARRRFGGGGGGCPRLGERFTQFMDENRDGKVSQDEFARISEVFDTLDKDQSGDLEQEELNQFFQALGGGQGRGNRADGPGGDRSRGDRAGGDRPGGGEGRRNFQMPEFADLDKNKDKKISKDEIPETFPPQMIDRLDQNKDGAIDEEEWNRSRGRGAGTGERFIQFMDANKDTKVSREEFARVGEVFSALDKDQSKELSSEELNQFFPAMAEVQARATGGVAVNNLFAKFDKDKDGKITAEEMGNERTFKALDLNNDGSIDREEADKALRQLAERSKQKQ